jgi:putative inorganic carbon (HCO3(-)) transporter
MRSWPTPAGAPSGTSDLLILAVATALALALGAYLGMGGDGLLAFGALAALAGGAVVVGLPLLGLAGLVFVIASNASDNLITYLGFPSLAKLMLPAALLLVAARWLVKGERPLFDAGVAWAFAAFGGLILIGLPVAANWQIALGSLSDFAKDAAMAMLIVSFFGRPAALPTFFATLYAVAAFVCTLALVKYLLGDYDNDYYGFARSMFDTARMAGPLTDPNFFGALLVILLPIPVYYLAFGPGAAVRLLGIYGVIVVLACIFLTQSRGTLLAVIGMAGLSLFIVERKAALRLGALFAVVALVAGVALSGQIAERFGTILSLGHASESQDESIQGRLAQWVVAVKQFADHPVLGVGSGNYNVRFQDYSLDLGLKFRNGQDRSAHSLYLEVLAEMGIVGLMGLLAILAAAARGIVRAMTMAGASGLGTLRARYACIGVGMVGYFLCMIFLHDAYSRMMWMMIAIAIALPRIAAVEIAATPAGPRALPS